MIEFKVDKKSFTPLEKKPIYGGDDIYKSSNPFRKGRVKTTSFLTGFTLIEILIVITIIIIMAALTVPNIKRQRINSNEAAAISGLKTLHTTLETYEDIYSAYPENLTILTTGTSPFIPTILVTACTITGIGGLSEYYHGYQFCYNRTNNYTYTCTAYPYTLNVTGTRYFRVTKSGVIEVQTDSNWTPLE